MSLTIPESDWPRFKEVGALLLEQFCQAVLDEVVAAAGGDGTAHARYLKVYRLIEQRDKQVADAFNDLRRSTAVYQLVTMRQMQLLTDEQLALFSERTREQVEFLASR